MRGTRRAVLWMLPLAGLLPGACAAPPPPGCAAGETPVREITAFFGRHVTRAGEAARRVSDADWDSFVADALTPRFPEGATILHGQGRWRDATGAPRAEDSSLLLLVVPQADAPAALARLRAAAALYRTRHAQDAVGITSRAACASGFS